MKHIKWMAIGTLLLLAVSGAAAQSLGDYARAVRKNKPEPTSASRHYDNDNLPTNETLSVVGPAPAADANAGQAPKAAAVDPGAAAAERQKTADAWKEKIDKQKEKVDSLTRDLAVAETEFQAHVYTSIVNGNNGKPDPAPADMAQHKSDIDARQKALEAARQELNEVQEQAHKAGIAAEDKDKDKEKEKDNDKDQNKGKE